MTNLLAPWPTVPVDDYGQMTCPILRCGANLYLIRSYCITLVAEQDTDHEAKHAVSDHWQVECTNGHVLHDGIDQLRQMNADDPEACHDETGDSAPDYDHYLTHLRISNLWGGPS